MYGEIKFLILAALDLGPKRMHLILGAACFAIVLAVTRRPWFSLAVVISLQLGNELLDAREDLARGRWSIREAIVDTAWTIVLPSAIATGLSCLAWFKRASALTSR